MLSGLSVPAFLSFGGEFRNGFSVGRRAAGMYRGDFWGRSWTGMFRCERCRGEVGERFDGVALAELMGVYCEP